MKSGFWGRITISLRSEAQHPQGKPKARGICAPTPKTPGPEFALLLNQAPSSLMSPGAAQSPRRATHFLLLRQEKVSKEKATLLSASLRCAAGNLRCSVQPGSSSNSLRSNNRSSYSVWTSAPRRIQKGLSSNSNSGKIEPALRAQFSYVFYSKKLYRVSRKFYNCKNLQYIQSQPSPHAAFEGI